MKKDSRLDARQIRILEDYFVRTLAGENMETIAKDNGIARKTLSTWKNTEHGKQLYAQYMKELSVNDVPLFYQKLKEGVAKNSFKHMELFAKIHGLLAPEKKEVMSKNENVNVNNKFDGMTTEEIKSYWKERLPELEAELDELPTIKRVK